jgi:hypothetical protein
MFHFLKSVEKMIAKLVDSSVESLQKIAFERRAKISAMSAETTQFLLPSHVAKEIIRHPEFDFLTEKNLGRNL